MSWAAAGLRLTWLTGWSSCIDAYVERLADDLPAAEQHLRAGLRLADEHGDRWLTLCASVELARVPYDQGRYEEALRELESFESAGPTNDTCTRYQALGLRAKHFARTGDLEQASAFAGRLERLAGETDYLVYRGEAYMDLAEVARLAGRRDQALTHSEQALRLWDEKGNVVMRDRTRALAGELRTGPARDRRLPAGARTP